MKDMYSTLSVKLAIINNLNIGVVTDFVISLLTHRKYSLGRLLLKVPVSNTVYLNQRARQ